MYGLSAAIGELALYIFVFLLFIYLNRRVKQQNSVYIVSFISLTAFLVHAWNISDIYSHNLHCKKTSKGESFVGYIPQAMFFMIFIWVIFKLLYIWRCMLVEGED